MLKNKKGFAALFFAMLLVILVMISTFALHRFLGLFQDLGEGHEVFLQDYYYAGFGIERGRWVIDNPLGGFGSGYTEEIWIDTTTFGVEIDPVVEPGNAIQVDLLIMEDGGVYTITSTANPGAANEKTIIATYEDENITSWESGE